MNIVEFSEAFDNFILRIKEINEMDSGELQSILNKLCLLLRISKIEINAYDNPREEGQGNGVYAVLYSDEYIGDVPELVQRHQDANGAISVIKYYRCVNDDICWTDEEIVKIKVIDTLLYTFREKIRMTEFAEQVYYYDKDYNLPNMKFFHKQRVGLVMANQFVNYGVCFFNLKRFAVINQLLTRELGTKVMCNYIYGMQDMLGSDGWICRVGGDNFITLFKKECIDEVVSYLAGREVAYGEEAGESVVVRASAGIYMAENNKMDDPVEKAHIALQAARHRPDTHAVYYNLKMQSIHEHSSMIESLFRVGLKKEEFLVYYQPKVQLSNYSIAGAEALARWKHDGQLISPDEFVPVLEQSNAICALDFYVLGHVCKDIRRWLDNGLNVQRVSVNLSRRHLGDDKLLEKIISTIDKYSVPHQYIEIELTETTTDVDFFDLKKIVRGLHEHGIHTSVDDFGVGYSSLNLIRQVAWDVVKIDKSFLPETSDKGSTQYLMFTHLLSMFRELGLKCIVEGVETIEQVKMLKENRCFLAQGYFFDRPLEVTEFEKRLVI